MCSFPLWFELVPRTLKETQCADCLAAQQVGGRWFMELAAAHGSVSLVGVTVARSALFVVRSGLTGLDSPNTERFTSTAAGPACRQR